MANELAKREGRDVQGEIRSSIDRILQRDLSAVDLSRHAFKTDEELYALKLNARQRGIVRAWQEPKKHVPFVLESSARRVEALLKGQTAAKKTTVNVENMTIQIPEKKTPELQPVIIEVEAK